MYENDWQMRQDSYFRPGHQVHVTCRLKISRHILYQTDINFLMHKVKYFNKLFKRGRIASLNRRVATIFQNWRNRLSEFGSNVEISSLDETSQVFASVIRRKLNLPNRKGIRLRELCILPFCIKILCFWFTFLRKCWRTESPLQGAVFSAGRLM